MNNIKKLNLIEATPEERAYHRGWLSFFDKDANTENPYDSKVEVKLFEKWKEGRTNAQIVNKSIPNV